MSSKAMIVLVFWAGLGLAALLSFVSYVTEREPKLPESMASLTSFDFIDHRNTLVDSKTLGSGATLINFACVGCREHGVGLSQAVRLANVLSPIDGFSLVTIPIDADQQWSEALPNRLGKVFGAAESKWHLYMSPRKKDFSIAKDLRIEGLSAESFSTWLFLVDGSLQVYGPYLAENPDSMIKLQNDAFNILRKLSKSKSIAQKSQN